MTLEIIYWDTDPFLAWLQEESDKLKKCKGTLERAENGEVLILTSALTIAEVLWKKGGPRVAQDKLVILRRFFRRSSIRVVNVTRSISELAQEIVYNNDIRPKDAVHVATALTHKSPFLETFDGSLIGKSGKCGGTPPLIIREPIAPPQTLLDFAHGH